MTQMSYQDPKHVDGKWQDEYWPDFRKHVHELLVWGYQVAKPQIKHKHDETDITGFIADAIQERLDSPDGPSWCDQFYLQEDPPIPGENRTGRHRRRPDIIFASVHKRPRPRYYFESKRLREQKTHRESYYLGQDGLGCFITSRIPRENKIIGREPAIPLALHDETIPQVCYSNEQPYITILTFEEYSQQW